MKPKIVSLILAALLLPAALWAQTGDSPQLRVNDYLRSGSSYGLGLQTLGLFDPSRMTFSHSYTMSYLSSGGQSAMRGLFMETIGYRLSNPLFLTLNLGFLHQPYSSFGPDGLTQRGTFIGGAALTWRPSKNMFLHFEVGNYPSNGISGYNPYWNPFPYNLPPVQNTQSTQESDPSGE